MVLVPKYTDDFREKVLAASAKSTFVFARTVMLFQDISENFHFELCERLDGRGDWGPDWRRAAIVMFRGSLKTSLMMAWASRQGLHDDELYGYDWTCRYVGHSFENAHENFLGPITKAFTDDKDAEYRQWLYQHRLPPDFNGWTSRAIRLRQVDPYAQATISIRGAGSSQEGTHVRAVIIDDPEGAEAEKADEQVDAIRLISHATPILVKPDIDRIVLVATPHGKDPVTRRAKHENFDRVATLLDSDIEYDNTKRVWKLHERPVLDKEDKPAWPERIDESTIRLIKATTSRDVWSKQYLLKEVADAGGWFDGKLLRESFASWKKGLGRRIIQYPAYKMDKEKYERTGELDIKVVRREVKVEELRYYLHFDPKHQEIEGKRGGNDRPASSGVVLVGVSPDFHVFVMETWAGMGTLEDQLKACYRLHMRYGAHKMTSESIGAQAWIENALSMFERANPLYRKLEHAGVMGDFRPIPKLSTIHERDERSTRLSKEAHIYERLEWWVTMMHIHLFETQEQLLNQFLGFPDSAAEVDLLDALAQGPPVWRPPAASGVMAKQRRETEQFKKVAHALTGFSSPLRRPKVPKGKSIGILSGEEISRMMRDSI